MMKDGWVAVRAAKTSMPSSRSSSTGGFDAGGGGGAPSGKKRSAADSGAGRYCGMHVLPQSVQSVPSSHLTTETVSSVA